MPRWVEASISILRCNRTGHESPHLTFQGDTDMVTAGLASLTSITNPEIVVVDLFPNELADDRGHLVERRINQGLQRNDLRSVPLRRVERVATPTGLSFQEFRRAYVSPTLIYTCPKCGSEAVAVRTETISDFRRDGGRLTILPDLQVRDAL